MPPTVFILDFGAQYSQLIARRTRELGVYCEIVPYDVAWSKLAPRDPAAIILSGGPESTLVDGAPGLDPAILQSGLPLLGICYGMQLLARDLGAELVKLDHAEYGPATLTIAHRESLFWQDVPEQSRVWMSHGDSVVKLPRGFEALGSTPRSSARSRAASIRPSPRRSWRARSVSSSPASSSTRVAARERRRAPSWPRFATSCT
jgi:GMP synthase (glutamine-hydrolysing)